MRKKTVSVLTVRILLSVLILGLLSCRAGGLGAARLYAAESYPDDDDFLYELYEEETVPEEDVEDVGSAEEWKSGSDDLISEEPSDGEDLAETANLDLYPEDDESPEAGASAVSERETDVSEPEADAEEEAVSERVMLWEEETLEPGSLPVSDPDRLFRGYVEEKLFGGERAALANYGEVYFEDNAFALKLYREAKQLIAERAANGGSSVLEGTFYLTEEDGLTKDEMERIASASIGDLINTAAFVRTLLNDCPFELYWLDKTRSVKFARGIKLTSDPKPSLRVDWRLTTYVTAAYREDGAEQLITADVQRIGLAAAEAGAVAAAHADEDDRQKLTSFKDYICEAVSYDYEALGTAYGDPWQLIYVFDGDPETNVVCEGYAKAFQYLCDLSDFRDTMVYTMIGNLGTELHMWNIVCLDGINYLVDVTNSDSGTIGSQGGLFLAEGEGDASGYTIPVGFTSVSYEYDERTMLVYAEDVRRLGIIRECTVSFEDGSGVVLLTSKTVNRCLSALPETEPVKDGFRFLGYFTEEGEPLTTETFFLTDASVYAHWEKLPDVRDFDWYLEETVFTYDGTEKYPPVRTDGEGAPAEGTDYTLSYSGNLHAGTGTVTVKGCGSYVGSVTLNFTIEKAKTRLLITDAELYLPRSRTKQLKIFVISHGSLTAVTDECRFTSSDSGIAGVSEGGLVTAKKPGSARITVTFPEREDYRSASVITEVTVPSLSVASFDWRLGRTSYVYDGKAKTPSVKAADGADLVKDKDYTLTYSSNIHAGTATVTVRGIGAFDGSVKLTYKITKAKTTLTLSVANPVLVKGRSVSAKVSAADCGTKIGSGGAYGTKSFKSSNTAAASVSSAGRLTGKKQGVTTLTVSVPARTDYQAATAHIDVIVIDRADYTGLVGKYYVKKGVRDTTYTGLVGNYYVKKGLKDLSFTGFSGKQYVVKGIKNTSYTGFVNQYYVVKGVKNTGFTGFVGKQYVVKGVKNTTYTGFVGNIYVKKGVKYTGLVGSKYYKNGLRDKTFTGLVGSQYVVKGVKNTTYTGLVGKYYVKKGVKDLTFTGFVGKQYVVKGIKNTTYTGLVGKYYVKKGVKDPTYTGPVGDHYVIKGIKVR